jgi:hypothetical protein
MIVRGERQGVRSYAGRPDVVGMAGRGEEGDGVATIDESSRHVQ